MKSKARDILYELSATLEAVGSKKRKRAGTVAEEDSEAVEIRLETINGVANGRAAAGGGLEPAVQMTGKKKARKKEKAELNAEDIALQEKPSAKAGKVIDFYMSILPLHVCGVISRSQLNPFGTFLSVNVLHRCHGARAWPTM